MGGPADPGDCETGSVPFTVVSFHAHPDDEALLTGGTLARVAAEGHRVVLVTATAGEAGLTAGCDSPRALAQTRRAELEAAASALGCSRVVMLGYPDSGSDRTPPEGTFAAMDPRVPAERLAEILREERADVLTTYDENGGYGHPDHVQVHRVGRLAATSAGTPVVLQATLDRGALRRVAGWLVHVPGLSRLVPDGRFASAYTSASELTHCVDVTAHLGAKRAALAAHLSQSGGGRGPRIVAVLVRLPGFAQRRVLGREWFREDGRAAGGRPLLDDIFASSRDPAD